LSLAKLVLQKANLLLLDEPTNHLDLAAREILESAILDFPGTIVMVTHDRYLLDRTADSLWVFEDGTIREYQGNYTDYRAFKDKQKTMPVQTAESTADTKLTRKDIRKTKAQIRSRTGKSSKYYEREIEKFENELTEIHTEMKNPALAVDWIALDALAIRERDVKSRLEELIAAWEITVEEEKILDQE
jgi:ATP-binding cassette, subfamily F, member 3